MARKFFVSAAAGFAVLVVPLAGGTAIAAPAAAQAPAATTVCYDASGAPSYASAISAGAANWNAAVSNVKLQSCSGATLRYVEGDDPQGSYAETDGHGSGTIFIDHTQA